jgi:hypothetical protein
MQVIHATSYMPSAPAQLGSERKPGKIADFIMLSDEIMAIPTTAIWKTRVTMTVVGGKIGMARIESLIGLALLATAAACAQDASQSFRLDPGDFRWVPFTVRQTPTAVDCRFEVLQGNPSVHVELLPMSEFRQFSRGRDHSTMAATPDGRSGNFRQVIAVRGQYAVVVVNGKSAPPATVALRFQANMNPNGADIAETLSPRRRLTVILISLAFFAVTVIWSGRKLLRAIHRS